MILCSQTASIYSTFVSISNNIKTVTETVVSVKHTERTAYGGSCLCETCMNTTPELCVNNIFIFKRYRMAALMPVQLFCT